MITDAKRKEFNEKFHCDIWEVVSWMHHCLGVSDVFGLDKVRDCVANYGLDQIYDIPEIGQLLCDPNLLETVKELIEENSK